MSLSPTSRADWQRIALVGLGLPAAIVLIDQILWFRNGQFEGGHAAGKFFFAWLVAKTAILSWCAGKYLGQTIYGWIVFFWCQVLLDVHTLGTAQGVFGYDMAALAHTLISAQIGFLAVWTFLGDAALPWRIASFLAALTAIIAHSRSLETNWRWMGMPLVQWMAAIVVALVAIALRFGGFRVRVIAAPAAADGQPRPETFQFGVKHMLIWTTALAPLLFVLKSIEDLAITQLTAQELYPAAMIGACIALVTLASIWCALGAGAVAVRLVVSAALIAAPGLLMSQLAEKWAPNPWTWSSNDLVNLVTQLGDLWWGWFACAGALLAGMLLFLRAAGYRLASAPGFARGFRCAKRRVTRPPGRARG